MRVGAETSHFPDRDLVEIFNPQASSSIVIVCEHASAHIPAEFADLGLAGSVLRSHIAWDPGALALAQKLATRLNAVLLAAKTSRLVYDCNRPPEARDAMPARSENSDVPGNAELGPEQKAQRTARYYAPFKAAVSEVMHRKEAPVLITVHSFTPIFHSKPRAVEIGILHDSDSRFADSLLSAAGTDHGYVLRRNEPYGPEHGVTHTLQEHALPKGHLNVMLEVRNDLIADDPAQEAMAQILADWITRALQDLGVSA